MHDLVLRNGLVVDGTGAEPVTADVAIDADEITRIGTVSDQGREEIDATNHIVTPGFVDLHTHLDAQIGWDPMLTPSSLHGITTVVLGNCGVTFAPCKPGDPKFLAGMMETVEDISREAILSGLSWNWETYGEYLDEIESTIPVINVAGLVGHCAVRYYVMGERGIDQQPDDDELAQMVELVRSSIKAGAVGFSTSRNPGHRIPDGRSVPGTYALSGEIAAIARVVGEHNGLMQTVMNMSDLEGEMALLREEAASARVLFSHYTGPTNSYGDKVEARVMAMRDNGLDVNAMIIPRASGFVTGLQAYLPWQGGPWEELSEMNIEQRLSAIRNPDFQSRLLDHAKENDPRITADLIYPISENTDRDTANYVGGPSESLKGIADKAGEHPAESFIRISNETDGKTFFTMRHFNRNLDALAKALSSVFCLPGLGDAGAHVRQVMDSGWTTFVMSYWHRDKGLFSLAEVVQQLTSAPARIIGLRDRGTLAPGKKADLNVIKLAALAECAPELVHDLPGGAPRLTQRARGYRATICNGQIILEHDRHTGPCAGTVLRHVVT